MKFENEDDELEWLAKNVPTKFAIMTIRDETTGVTIKVDQSLDSGIAGSRDQMESLAREFLNIYLYWKGKKYSGEFDGKNRVKINKLSIDFDTYSGETAWIWLMRYVKVVVNLMNRDGIIKLKDIENDFKGSV